LGPQELRAKGAEGVRLGRGVPLANRLGSVVSSGVRGGAANAFFAYLRPTEHFWWRGQCYFTE